MTEASPAGWYPDPAGDGGQRWDGAAWTGHLQPPAYIGPPPSPPRSPALVWLIVALGVAAQSRTGTCWLMRLDLSLGTGAPMMTGKLPPDRPCQSGTDPSLIVVEDF